MLASLAWRMYHNPEALWDSILYHKYYRPLNRKLKKTPLEYRDASERGGLSATTTSDGPSTRAIKLISFMINGFPTMSPSEVIFKGP